MLGLDFEEYQNLGGNDETTLFCRSLAAALAVATLVATPAAAAVKGAMKANSGYCKSGKLVGDTKVCKENGGKK